MKKILIITIFFSILSSCSIEKSYTQRRSLMILKSDEHKRNEKLHDKKYLNERKKTYKKYYKQNKRK